MIEHDQELKRIYKEVEEQQKNIHKDILKLKNASLGIKSSGKKEGEEPLDEEQKKLASQKKAQNN